MIIFDLFEDSNKKPQGVTEGALNELAGYGSNKAYQSVEAYKRYDVYVSRKKFNNIAFIAVAENPRTRDISFKAKGNTQQEAVDNLKAEIDREIDTATKVSGQATLDFNVDFVKAILELSADTFYAKIIPGPRLVIAGSEMLQYPDIMRSEGFKPSSIRTSNSTEGTTPLPGVPLSSKAAVAANLIANGRYVLGDETVDRDGNRVFDLNFDSVVQASNDKMRLRAPAVTVGTNRSPGVTEGEHDAKFRDDQDSFYHMADFAHKQMRKGQSLQDIIQYLRDNNYLEPQEVNSFVKQVRGEKWNESVTENQYEIHHLDPEGRRKAIYHHGKGYTDDVVRKDTQYHQERNPSDTFRVFKDKQPFDWQGVTEAEGPGRVDPILYKALARMTKGGYDDAKIALAIEFGLLDMKHNYAIANNYIPKLVDLYNQKHGVTESLEDHERYQYIVTLKSGKRIRFLCSADCDVKTYIERKYKEPVVDIKDQGIVGEPPVELLPGEIKEGSQSFHNGMQVKLTPEYADRPDEVFTVAHCDRERGRCWIGDEQGRGWYASFDQLIPVEDDEDDEVDEGEVTKTATGMRHRSTDAYGGTPREPDPLRTLDKATTNKLDQALGVKYNREKKWGGGLDLTNEVSPEYIERYKKEHGRRATAADQAGDYAKGHEHFKKINQLTKQQFQRGNKPEKVDEISNFMTQPTKPVSPEEQWKRQIRLLAKQYQTNAGSLAALGRENGPDSAEAVAYEYLRDPSKIRVPGMAAPTSAVNWDEVIRRLPMGLSGMALLQAAEEYLINNRGMLRSTVRSLLNNDENQRTLSAAYAKKKTPAESVTEESDNEAVEQAIARRIMVGRTDLLLKYGPRKVMQAVEEVADYVGAVDEIGSSDVSGWVAQVERALGGMSEAANPAQQAAIAINMKKQGKTPKHTDEAKATSTRLDPKCWTGKKIGNPKTKVKGGVRVNNCVPK